MNTLFGFEAKNYFRNVLILAGFIIGIAILLMVSTVSFLRQRR